MQLFTAGEFLRMQKDPQLQAWIDLKKVDLMDDGKVWTFRDGKSCLDQAVIPKSFSWSCSLFHFSRFCRY